MTRDPETVLAIYMQACTDLQRLVTLSHSPRPLRAVCARTFQAALDAHERADRMIHGERLARALEALTGVVDE